MLDSLPVKENPEQCHEPPCLETAGKLPSLPPPCPPAIRRVQPGRSPEKSECQSQQDSSRLAEGVCYCSSPGVEGCPKQVWQAPRHSRPEVTNSAGCGRAGGTTCPPLFPPPPVELACLQLREGLRTLAAHPAPPSPIPHYLPLLAADTPILCGL